MPVPRIARSGHFRRRSHQAAKVPPQRGVAIGRALIAMSAAALVLAGCSDQRTLIAPEDDASFSRGAGNSVDVIVVLKEEFAPGGQAANRSRAAEVAQGVGIEARFTYGSVLFGFAGSVPEGRLSALRNHPLVEYVDLDGIASIPPTVEHHRPGHGQGGSDPAPDPNPQFTPWGVHRIGPAENGATGSGVSVYILDTGISSNHPDLQANLGAGYAPMSCEGGCANPWDDDHGHGTHVAGTVGAIDNDIGVVGVAPQVTLHAVKVLGSTGSGPWSGIIAGIDWVATQDTDRVRVINMSLGGGGEKTGSCTADGYVGSPNSIYESICNAKNAGVVIVTSAGNSGANASSFAPASYYDAVITVSAVECRSVNYGETEERCGAGSEGWTPWSNWGFSIDEAWPSRNSLPVLIGAPGLHVLSTTIDGDIGHMSGTSMASPHVAGAVALLLQSGSYSADGSAFAQIRQTLLDNAECTADWDDRSGRPHNESFLDLQTGSGACAPPRDPPPAPPVPTELAAEALSHHEIRLTWTYEEPVPADVQFQLSRWNGSAWATSGLLGQDLSFTNAGLPPETTFTYRVRAVRDGVSSEWSAGATATTHVDAAPLVAPTDLRADGVTSSTVDLKWDHPSPADSRFEIWQLYSNAWSHLAYVEGQASYTAEGLAPSTGYSYAVRTVRGTEMSTWSNTLSITTLPGDSDPPVADFTYACGNSDTCRFTNRSTGSLGQDAFHWDLGNGESRTTHGAQATYTSERTYIVRLTVTDVLGRSASKDTAIACVRRGNRLRCQ